MVDFMATTVLAQKCVTGNIESYLFKMKAGTLIDTVGYASEMEQWEDMTVDERMQRDINGVRVATEIVPYIVSDPNWFFGSLIIDLYQGGEELVFQDINEVVETKFAAYAGTLKDVGFLTLPDNKRLIALDGQHRLAALSMDIKGKNGIPGSVGKKVSDTIREDLVPHPEISNADISIILIKHTDNKTIRNIFNKVNRYAKQTSRSDNIITAEDDMVAIVSRQLFSASDGPLRARDKKEMVNWTSNTIPIRSKQLTTLSALYTISETILQHYDITPKTPINDADLAKAKSIMYDFWNISLEKIDAFKTYIEYSDSGKSLENVRKENLLFKPVTHMALAQAVQICLEYGYEYKNIVDRFNLIDWSQSNKVWSNILVTNSNSKRMITGTKALKDAGMLIAYMVIGSKFSEKSKQELLQKLRDAGNDQSIELPPIV